MKWIKEYRLIIMAVAALVVLVVGTRGEREEPAGPGPYEGPLAAQPQAGVTPSREAPRLKPLKNVNWQSEPAPSARTAAVAQNNVATEEAQADSAVEEKGESFNPEEARLKAVEKVNAFNEELASTLWTTNPNALKTRLKASELNEKADELDQWIETQDARTDLTDQERLEWQAQRAVWVNQSKQLKQVAQRLTATRGSRRKVRILAQEIRERTGD